MQPAFIMPQGLQQRGKRATIYRFVNWLWFAWPAADPLYLAEHQRLLPIKPWKPPASGSTALRTRFIKDLRLRKSVLPWYFPCPRHSRRSGAHLDLGQYTYPPPPPMSDPTATQGWYGGYSYGQTSKSPTPSMDPRGLRRCLQGRIMKLRKPTPEVSCSHSQCRRPRFSGPCRHRVFPSLCTSLDTWTVFARIAFNLCCVA